MAKVREFVSIDIYGVLPLKQGMTADEMKARLVAVLTELGAYTTDLTGALADDSAIGITTVTSDWVHDFEAARLDKPVPDDE